MAKKEPSERFSIDNMLAKRESDLRGAQTEHAHQSLALIQAPDNADLKRAVETLEAEIQGHEQAITRLRAARTAKASQSKALARDEIERTHAERSRVVRARSAEIRAVTEELVTHIEALGPLIARLGQANSEHRAVLRQVLCDAYDFRTRDAMFQPRSIIHPEAAVRTAVVHAARRAGLFTSEVLGESVRPPHGGMEPIDKSADLFAKHDAALDQALANAGEATIKANEAWL